MSRKNKYVLQKVNTYDEAYKIGKKYIDDLTTNTSETYNVDKGLVLPVELSNPIWEMSHESLGNTLKYIFEYLHHQCYMLCINNNDVLLCKLSMNTTAPVFREKIERSLSKLQKNRRLTPDKRSFIKESLTKNIDKLRVMQCVVKPFSNDDQVDSNEYLDLLRGLNLPNGVFILNLTDAVILRNMGKSPFVMVTGKVSVGDYEYKKHLPILSMSGQRTYLDVPIPNYDDVMRVLKDDTLKPIKQKKRVVTGSNYKDIVRSNMQKSNKHLVEDDMKTNWDDKKIVKAVFRGGPTGCGYTEDTNMRIKLAMMSSSLIDVRLSKPEGATSIDTKSIKYDPVHGLGIMNTGINFKSSFLSMKDQSNYKYIIHVDGNVNAYRLLSTMTTGSLILRVMSPYTSWVDHMIKHKVHYIPIKEDLSDLLHVINWCKNNDDECRQIAQNGLEFARSVLTRDFIQKYMQTILWSLSPNNEPPMALDKESESIDSSSKEDDRISGFSDEYIDFPSDKKRCPRGYSSKIYKNKKVCKKNKTRKKK
jgi:hypothetical protein